MVDPAVGRLRGSRSSPYGAVVATNPAAPVPDDDEEEEDKDYDGSINDGDEDGSDGF